MQIFTLEMLKAKPLIAQPVTAFDSLCHIAEMTADEQDTRFFIPWLNRKERLKQEDNRGFRAFSVAACLCDSSRKFMAATTAEINTLADQLSEASTTELSKLAYVAAQLNGIGEPAVEVIEKN